MYFDVLTTTAASFLYIKINEVRVKYNYENTELENFEKNGKGSFCHFRMYSIISHHL